MKIWPTKKLGEICEENLKSPFKVEDADNVGDYPFFTSGGNVLKHSKFLVDGENIFLSTGGYAHVKYYNGKISYSADTWSLKVKNVLPKFIYYQILGKIKFIDSVLFRGTGLRHLQKKEFLNIQTLLPPLSIQQKIVSILDTIQSAIEVQEKIIEETKELKKSLMADLFKYGAPSFRRGRKLKKTEIGEIPEDWEVVKLKDVCIIRREQVLPKEDDIYVGLEHLDSGIIKLSRYGTGKEVKSLKNKFYPEDILYGKLRPYLDKAIITEKEGVCSTDLIVIICDKSKILPYYLINLIHTPKFLNFAVNTMTGTNHPRTSWDNLRTFKFPLSTIFEQQKVVEILQTIDEKIEIEKKKKELYEELFKTMLNKLMNQEIDVENLQI